jgi:hypothetical protein
VPAERRLLLRDDLSDETAKRETEGIGFAKTQSAYERDGVLSHLLDRFAGRLSGCADPTIVERNHVVASAVTRSSHNVQATIGPYHQQVARA